MDKQTIIDFFDGLADKWDSWQDGNNPIIALAIDLITPSPNLKILDTACGTGIIEPFLEKYNPNYMLCVDISSKMIDLAKAKSQNSWAKYLNSDIFDVTENEFDICIIHNALPHFEDFKRLIDHVSQRLKNGGRIVILHSESRDSINKRHMAKADAVSRYLPKAKELADIFKPIFDIDIIIDTKKIYMVSGVKVTKN